MFRIGGYPVWLVVRFDCLDELLHLLDFMEDLGQFGVSVLRNEIGDGMRATAIFA
jgi:hypothetical protein